MNPRGNPVPKIVSALAALALAACAAATREPPPKPFVGTQWIAQLELPIPGDQPWVRMGDGRLEGFGGCNRISSRYIQDTVGARAIAFGVFSSSKKLCDDAIMGAERRVLEVLQAASSYSVTGDELTMTGSAGTMRFRAKADPKAEAAPK